MAEITAAMVKELRERTGLGMMECKKALTAAGGDIEKAIDDMRAAGAIKAAKKAGNIAAEGSIAVKIAADNKAAVIIEVNSQTDFLALQDDFKGFVAESLEKAFNEKLTDAAPLVEAREEARLALVASNPQFLSASEVSEEAIAKEKEIFLALNADKIAGKPENIVENMVKGRISKFLAEASLVEQPFVKNPEVKVGDLAKQAGAEIVSFVRYEVGEGIEKAEVDFAAEVAAQVAATKQ